MGRLWEYARQQWRRFVWGGAMLLLTNATAMAVPQLFRLATDGIRGGMPATDMRALALTLVYLALAGMVFRTLSRVHILFAARDVELALRCAMFRHLTGLPPPFFDAHPTGDLMSRAVNDLTQIRLMLGPGLLNVVNTVVAYAVALPLMLAISVKLTVIAFVIYPPTIALMRHLGRQLYARNRAQQAALGALSAGVQESLAGAQLVRAFVLEAEQVRRFAGVNDAALAANLSLVWTRSSMFRVAGSLAGVGTLALVTVGARDVIAGAVSLGDVVALVEYMALLSGPTFALGWVLSLWQRGAASMARLEEVLGAPAAAPPAGAPVLPAGPVPPTTAVHAPPPTLRLRGLAVAFATTPALVDISLEVPAGTTLGIVGPIGAGKSTLLRALLRLVEVPAGAAFLGAVDIADMELVALRRSFGYVPQTATLLSRTLAANIAFGRPDASAAEVAAAVHAAALDADVAALPRGLQTEVGERGVALSGGQKQRAALARALLLAPPILLLDDALSAVDSATEEAILARLRPLRRGRTTLVVAHRVSAVQHAEHIVVLAAGRIAERGTHAELVAHGGIYADMAHRQHAAAADT